MNHPARGYLADDSQMVPPAHTSFLVLYSLLDIYTWFPQASQTCTCTKINSHLLSKPALVAAFHILLYVNSICQLLRPKRFRFFGITFSSYQVTISALHWTCIQIMTSLTTSTAATPWPKHQSSLAWTTEISFSWASLLVYPVQTPVGNHSNMTGHIICSRSCNGFPISPRVKAKVTIQ